MFLMKLIRRLPRLGTTMGLKDSSGSLSKNMSNSPKEIRTFFFGMIVAGVFAFPLSIFFIFQVTVKLTFDYLLDTAFLEFLQKPLSSSPFLNCFRKSSLTSYFYIIM